MKFHFFFTALSGVLLFISCKKYQTQYEGPYSDGQAVEVPVAYEILAVVGGELYLFDDSLAHSKKVTGSPSGIETASINFSHDLIAYKKPGKNIEIIDTSGNIIASVFDSADGYSFDWHSNNETLYYLKDGRLYFYGPPISVSVTNLNTFYPPGAQDKGVFGVAVTQNGDVWTTYGFTGSQGYTRFLNRSSSSGGSFYTVGFAYATTEWMRTTSAGDMVYFGLYSASESNVWAVNRPASNYGIFYNYRYTAYDPDGIQTVFSNGPSLFRYLSSGVYAEIPLTGTVTALDW